MIFPSTFTSNTGSAVVAVSLDIFLLRTLTLLWKLCQQWSSYFIVSRIKPILCSGSQHPVWEQHSPAERRGYMYILMNMGKTVRLQPYPVPKILTYLSPYTNITFNNNQATVTCTGNSIFPINMYDCDMRGHNMHLNSSWVHNFYNKMFNPN